MHDRSQESILQKFFNICVYNCVRILTQFQYCFGVIYACMHILTNISQRCIIQAYKKVQAISQVLRWFYFSQGLAGSSWVPLKVYNGGATELLHRYKRAKTSRITMLNIWELYLYFVNCKQWRSQRGAGGRPPPHWTSECCLSENFDACRKIGWSKTAN